MKVFVTGATGFVGSAVVRELLAAGHQVLGLARSDTAAASLATVGAEVHRGSLDDLESLRNGANESDGVIHTAFDTAFDHDLFDFAKSAAIERQAIETFGATLAGSGRPFVVTSATGSLPSGGIRTEEEDADTTSSVAARFAMEDVVREMASRGVRTSIVRLPPSVHDEDDHGFVPTLIATARAKGVSAYPGDGSNRWASVHRLDAAHVYRLALENAEAGSRFHAIADEGVPVREIAEIIGRHLSIPVASLPVEQAVEHFGWIGTFFAKDCAASSTLTQQRLGWHPVRSSLLEDLDQGHYFKQ
ncbi:SDR family oxidoreductase [Reticulibacter mediterranei]|nr:SDR family oxidoreductase [Reticulibacter mediterranei]